MRDLVDRLNALCDEQPFTTTWFLRDLRTGETADRDGDVVVPSASTRKIAVLMAALKAVHEGRLRLDDPFTIDAKYQDNTSGTFQHLSSGSAITFQDALVMMIIVSDNTCTAKVVDIVGLDAINALSRSVGMVSTTHRHNMPPKDLPYDHPVELTNATTANDVGLLLDLILRGTSDEAVAAQLGSTPELCKLALQILLWQKLNNRLPLLLPSEARVAHKTGTGARNYNDAGIVFQGDTPLIIQSVYTDGLPTDMPDGTNGYGAAALHMARLAKTCYDALRQPSAAPVEAALA
ncbi:MAG: class A beta-lactamase-related serine hydrolase [Chloroflexota bacterium]|nr:class A beta-lactamase-related serine hydrolase [Chloroflexota bacterium]